MAPNWQMWCWCGLCPMHLKMKWSKRVLVCLITSHCWCKFKVKFCDHLTKFKFAFVLYKWACEMCTQTSWSNISCSIDAIKPQDDSSTPLKASIFVQLHTSTISKWQILWCLNLLVTNLLIQGSVHHAWLGQFYRVSILNMSGLLV